MRSRPEKIEDRPLQLATAEQAGRREPLGRERARGLLLAEDAESSINVHQVRAGLVDSPLVMVDQARDLGSLGLQGGEDMRFGHAAILGGCGTRRQRRLGELAT